MIARISLIPLFALADPALAQTTLPNNQGSMDQYSSPNGSYTDELGVDISTGSTKIGLEGDLAGAGFGRQRMVLNFDGGGEPVNSGTGGPQNWFANGDDVAIVRSFSSNISLVGNKLVIPKSTGLPITFASNEVRSPAGKIKFQPYVPPVPPQLPTPTQSDGSIANYANKSTRGVELIGGPNPGIYSSDGALLVFSATRFNSALSPGNGYNAPSYLIDKVVFADGETWTYYYNDMYFPPQTSGGVTLSQDAGWRQSRIKFIVSNKGYGVQFSYAVDHLSSAQDPDVYNWLLPVGIKYYNKAYYYCNESALVNCAAIASLPEMAQLSYNQSNKSMTVSLGGVTKIFQYQRYLKFGISYTEPDLELSSVSNPSVPGSIITYSYAYDGGRLYGNPGGGTTSCLPANRGFHYIIGANHGASTWQYGYGAYCSSSVGYYNQVYRISPTNSVARVSILPSIGQIKSYIDELGRNTVWGYLGFNSDGSGSGLGGVYPSGFLSSKTSPEGDAIKYAYDVRGNVLEKRAVAKVGSTLADIVETWNFSSECLNPRICNKPNFHVDASGNTTSYTYDATHGGVLTETDPAVLVNGTGSVIAPVKRYAYVQRYAWISDGGGGYVQAASPVWLLDTMRTCRTTVTVSGACAGGAADEVVTSYDYGPNSGPNNLLLRGLVVTADGKSLRTCYGYDMQGNKISETTPRAGLTQCQ